MILGSQAGGYGSVENVSEDEQNVHIGVSPGGFPGGGDGRSANAFVTCGGGGGYTCLQRKGPFGDEIILVAGGGGGAGSHDGAGANDDGMF